MRLLRRTADSSEEQTTGTRRSACGLRRLQRHGQVRERRRERAAHRLTGRTVRGGAHALDPRQELRVRSGHVCMVPGVGCGAHCALPHRMLPMRAIAPLNVRAAHGMGTGTGTGTDTGTAWARPGFKAAACRPNQLAVATERDIIPVRRSASVGLRRCRPVHWLGSGAGADPQQPRSHRRHSYGQAGRAARAQTRRGASGHVARCTLYAECCMLARCMWFVARCTPHAVRCMSTAGTAVRCKSCWARRACSSGW